MIKHKQEVELAAKNMIERYGDQALEEVDLRIMELEVRNQPEAVQLWREIKGMIELLAGQAGGNTRH